ncbi:chloroplast protein cs/ch-42 [Gossypium australe]|uniref:Chloroplast protein cs/ch-42 n=1 Tax=Gossypium australe TaxID=47621 RepID=A0A5B6WB27_9ROSI|nr:chloroplast protein cs/ch-42 [Gossypium australe]
MSLRISFYECCEQMAEPQKATSSAVDSKSKEKKSMLDEEIGKDFLGSWKSMSVKDDALDFSFETTTKGKNKAFNFDKLMDVIIVLFAVEIISVSRMSYWILRYVDNFLFRDIDFNLDDDFGKFSSFKVDMPDLDFSSPAKKDAKAKEKSKEETNSGKQQEKKDRLAFAFNFNELDDFDFDSALNKGEKTSKKNQESKDAELDDFDFDSTLNKGEKTSKKNKECKAAELDDFDFDSTLNIGEKTSKKNQEGKAAASESTEVSKIDQALEDDLKTERLPESRDAANSKAETSKGRVEACKSTDNPCPSKAVPAQGPAPEKMDTAQESRISPETSLDTNAEETYKSSPSPEREVSSELYDQQSLQSSPMDSRNVNNSNPETISDMQAEVCSQGRRTKTSSASEQNVKDNVIINESIQENLHRKNSFPLSESDRDGRKGASGNIPAEIDDSLLVQDDIVLKGINTTGLSTDNIAAKKYIQNPTPKLPSVSLDSEPTDTEQTARNEKEAGAIRSRFFRRLEENRSQLHQPSEIEKEVSSFSGKNNGGMHLSPVYEKREDFGASEAQSVRKLVDYSKLSSQELTKRRSVLQQSENNIGSSSDIRAGFAASAIQNGANKLISKSSLQDKAARKGDPVLLRTEKNASLQANPPNHTEKTTESSVQKSLNPKLQVPKMHSIQNSMFHSEAHKITKNAPALSCIKSTRSIGPKTDHMSSQKETNSLGNLEQNKDTRGNTSNIVLPEGVAETQTPKFPSLKRKTFQYFLKAVPQESNGDTVLLKSLKRLSQSPTESRNLTESSERVADKEVQNHKNHVEVSTKNVLYDHLTSGSEVPREVNMTEPEFASVIENDGKVEKAEAYGKELEDICNMLKKKNEEAKQVLVRAIVNNNNLLMLNHPILKEKISFPILYYLRS